MPAKLTYHTRAPLLERARWLAAKVLLIAHQAGVGIARSQGRFASPTGPLSVSGFLAAGWVSVCAGSPAEPTLVAPIATEAERTRVMVSPWDRVGSWRFGMAAAELTPWPAETANRQSASQRSPRPRP